MCSSWFGCRRDASAFAELQSWFRLHPANYGMSGAECECRIRRGRLSWPPSGRRGKPDRRTTVAFRSELVKQKSNPHSLRIGSLASTLSELPEPPARHASPVPTPASLRHPRFDTQSPVLLSTCYPANPHDST